MDNEQPTRILVAGATGTLGRSLIPVLQKLGREVVALVRPGSRSRLEFLEDEVMEIVSAEITRPDIESSLFNGVHTVISSIGITTAANHGSRSLEKFFLAQKETESH